MNNAGLQTAIQGVQAQNTGTTLGTRSLPQLFDTIAIIVLNPLITLFFAGALIYFLIGVVEYIRNADNESKRKEGGSRIVWGLVGMAIMVSAFAIVALIRGTIGV